MVYMKLSDAKSILRETNIVMGVAATYYEVAMNITNSTGNLYINDEAVRLETVERIAPIMHLFSEEVRCETRDHIHRVMKDALIRIFGERIMVEVTPGKVWIDRTKRFDKPLYHRGIRRFGANTLREFALAVKTAGADARRIERSARQY